MEKEAAAAATAAAAKAAQRYVRKAHTQTAPQKLTYTLLTHTDTRTSLANLLAACLCMPVTDVCHKTSTNSRVYGFVSVCVLHGVMPTSGSSMEKAEAPSSWKTRWSAQLSSISS
eukprot:3074800-Rhodomonas_salina.1